jgi:hypothetical protein
LAVETLGAARLAKEIPAQRAVATIVRRDEITAVLQDPEASPELFLRVTSGGFEESDLPSVIAMTWSRDELERLLESATGENVVLTFDRDELSQAFGDVEAHGLRERALVFAVAATSALGTGAAIANAMPERKSMRRRRAYATEPERALKKTTTRLIAVMVAGLSAG